MNRENKFIREILFWKDCKEYSISIWACPTFLFIVMGVITIGGVMTTYYIGQRYTSIELITLLSFAVALGLFIPGSIIVNSFEKMALANRMKSEFVSIVSHQLRSPSSAMKWSLNLLMSDRLGELNKKQSDYIRLINQNNERMLKLVNDLLNVSRIDRGELSLRKDSLDLEKLVQKSVNNIMPLADSRKIKLEFKEREAGIPNILGDEVYVGIVIGNFLDNAIRYSKEGSGRISVRILFKQNNIRFEVEDNGVGIEEEERARIFDKFFRSSTVIRSGKTGTGLGLFIAKHVIEEMDGKIGFDSGKEKGTIFWFEVPGKE